MTKHLDGKLLTTLCSLLSIKHIGGRPSSAPKLTRDTEYISRASRAQSAMTHVRRTAATEVSVSSANEFDIWIAAESGTNNWTAAGYMAVVHDLCMLVVLLAVWRTSRWVRMEISSDGTRTSLGSS